MSFQKIIGVLLVCLMSQSVLAKSRGSHMYNLRFQPISLLVGVVNADLDYKIHDQIVVGPTAAVVNTTISDVSLKASSIGAVTRYYFEEALTGSSWYLSGKATYTSVKASLVSSGVTYTGDVSGFNFGVGGGYQWSWESFNQSLGAYVVATTGEKIELKDSNGTKYNSDSSSPFSRFSIEYSLGWMF